MRTSDFDYELPAERIAQTPIEPRDAARLMIVDRSSGEIEHQIFRRIVDYLQPNDLLVANDSRVIPARLAARKVPTGGQVELLLLTRHAERTWEVLVKGRRVRPGTRLVLVPPHVAEVAPIYADVLEITAAGGRIVEFDEPITPQLEQLGEVPLPPYIHTPLEDAERYQTVYARVQGSAAAPTAGLHFTPRLIGEIERLGINFAFVTLHIGLDTFRPVQVEELENHEMHSEYAMLPAETAAEIRRARDAGGRVVAVGTTAVRVLESAAHLAPAGVVTPFSGWTDLFIYPGYQFRAVDALITNFHLPRSTLLMLVSAFAGRDLVLEAYGRAITSGYRFYSFGDAMFIR
jgi:S-adenosylmethionine:tRNA ribosyltransferase-isomerase